MLAPDQTLLFLRQRGRRFGYPGVGSDLRFDVGRHFRMLLEEIAHVVLALSDAVGAVAVPRAGLLDDLVQHPEVDHLALARNALAIEDVEIGLTKWWRHFVLHHLNAGLAADDFIAFLDRAYAADVEAHGGIELERIAAGCRFRVAEHHADLHAYLIDEDDQRVRALDVGGELA